MKQPLENCRWPGCPKRVRKDVMGLVLCRPHKADERGAFIGMMRLEGPATLNRQLPTISELFEFSTTGELPESRLIQSTFETTKMKCGYCRGPLVMLNDADWSPELPNALSTRKGNQPWGVGVCQCCSGKDCPHRKAGNR